MVHRHCIWYASAATVARLSTDGIVGAAVPTGILHIQAPEYAPKLRLKIGEHLVNRIAATLIGVYVTTVKANDTVVPSVRNIEVIRIRRADDRDGGRHIHRENGGIDARKT